MLKIQNSIWQLPETSARADDIVQLLSKSKSLSGINLKKLLIGSEDAPKNTRLLSFNGFQLEKCDFERSHFACGFIRAQVIETNYSYVYFDTCIFRHTKFQRSIFKKATFRSPDLNDACFIDCNFDESKLTGRTTEGYGGRRVLFENTSFRDCKITGLHFRASTFRNCDFTNVQSSFNTFVACKFPDSIGLENLRIDSDDFNDAVESHLP
jgi:uncharacterized protein YjbI with pentapeptide repeats